MHLLHGLEGLTQLPAGAVISIGNFDGVHLGHQRILHMQRDLQSASLGAAMAVVTFEPHPLTVLRPSHVPPRLAPPLLKRQLLESAGVEYLVNLAPTPQVLTLTAEQFWQILRDEVRPAHLVEGASFRFGKGATGTVDLLRQWSSGTSVAVHVADSVSVPLLDLTFIPVSSSAIRFLLGHGRVRDAAICLGRPYTLQGAVIRGFGRGRTIGIPTANLQCSEQLIPADGVYAGHCRVDGSAYPAAISIGSMPTFGDHPRQIEAHLLGFDGDLHGRTLDLELSDWLRDQQKFPSIDALKRQLAQDINRVRADQRNPARPIIARW